MLEVEHEIVPVDFNGGEHKTPEFLKINPFGEIPVLVDGDIVLRDSQAILVYLARRYGDDGWLPVDPEPSARVVQWLSIAANEIQNGPNPARRAIAFGRDFDVPAAQEIAHRLLKFMDLHLRDREWLATGRPTIADLACYPYLALAPEGDISLAAYPAVRTWIGRVETLPGYVPMPGLPATV